MNTCPICKREIEGGRCNNIACAMFASPPAELEQVRAAIESERQGAYERARDEAAQAAYAFVKEHHPIMPDVISRHITKGVQYHPAAPVLQSAIVSDSIAAQGMACSCGDENCAGHKQQAATDKAERVERERRAKM